MGGSLSIANVERSRESILLALHTHQRGVDGPLSTFVLAAFHRQDPHHRGWIASSSLGPIIQDLGLTGRWDRLQVDTFAHQFVLDDGSEGDGARTSHRLDYLAFLDTLFYPIQVSVTQLTITNHAVISAGGWLVHDGEFGGRSVVAKELALRDSHDHEETVAQLRRRINALRVVSHLHIVRYVTTVETNQSLYVVQQAHASCTLHTILSSFGPMKEATIRRYVTQVLDALRFLHNHDIVHGNLHLESIHIDSSGLLKLSDFGASDAYNQLLFFSPDAQPRDWVLRFLPAELKIAGGRATKAADVWSLGILILQMACGVGDEADRVLREPTTHKSSSKENGSMEQPPIPSSMSTTLRRIVSECLQRRRKARPTIEQICQHDLFHVDPATSEILRDVCADLDASMHRLTSASRRVSELPKASTRPSTTRHFSSNGRLVSTGRSR